MLKFSTILLVISINCAFATNYQIVCEIKEYQNKELINPIINFNGEFCEAFSSGSGVYRLNAKLPGSLLDIIEIHSFLGSRGDYESTADISYFSYRGLKISSLQVDLENKNFLKLSSPVENEANYIFKLTCISNKLDDNPELCKN